MRDLDRTVQENAANAAKWLQTCAATAIPGDYGGWSASCAGCPYLGGECSDGLMAEAARVLAMLYDPGQEGYPEAQKLISRLQICVADNTCLEVCQACPYANGCPSGLLGAAADLIRAACHQGR